MLGRFISLAGFIAAVSVGVAAFTVRPPDPAPSASSDDNGNFTTERRTGGSWSSAGSGKREAPGGGVRLDRASDSHFYADTNVDGTSVRMMVDSGASIVALTRGDAEAIGIDVDRLPVAGMARTAGGEVPMRVVMLRSVDVNGIEVRGVEAAVIDTDMGVSLLGQSYLSKLEVVNVEGDVMTLR